MKRFISILATVIILVTFSFNTPLTHAASIPDTSESLGAWSCWDDGTVDPCHNTTMYSISMVSEDDGWSVGAKGAIQRWNGYNWSSFTSPTVNDLNEVSIYSSTYGWAVGNHGTFLKWNGTEWGLISAPITRDIRSISIVSATDAWAVGWGDIFHWNGTNWSQVSTPNANSRHIAMVPGSNGTDGWTVGYQGSILRWNGEQWSVFQTPTNNSLYDIVMLSPNDGWIVGWQSTFLHWDGFNWSIVEFNGNSFDLIQQVDAFSASDVWAIGNNQGTPAIYHWNGIEWHYFGGDSDAALYEAFALTPGSDGNQGWIFGEAGYIQRWNGSQWLPFSTPITKNISGIKMLSTDDGWAISNFGVISQGHALHWNGNYWNKSKSLSGNNLDMIHTNEDIIGWIIGDYGRIHRWNGSSWEEEVSPTTQSLKSVDILTADDAWAAGMSTIIHYENNEWITVTIPISSKLYDISMVSPSYGWAVGEEGVILKWNGSTWQVESIGNYPDLNSIKTDGSTGWIVGASGIILRWNGTSWVSQASPTLYDLTDVDFYSPSDAWAVGKNSTILHWDGLNWVQVEAPLTPDLKAINYSSQYELWAVGDNGVILHYQYRPSLEINYTTGAPGSHFTITGTQYPPDQSVHITINGQSIGDISSDSNGNFTFILSTALADEGYYNVTASVNPSASVRFTLDNDSPDRLQEGSFTIFDVPAGIAYSHIINLPITVK